MARIFADRVRETSTTTGTGTFDLDGPVASFQSFVAGVGTTNECHYCIENGTDWEVGTGTVTDAAPDTLSRDTILASSNGDAAVSWGAGEKNVFAVIPADFVGDPNFKGEDTGAAPVASGTNSIAAGPNTLADATNAVAVGGDGTTGAQARAPDALAIGRADARENSSISIGRDSQAGQTAGGSTEAGAVAIGQGAMAFERQSIAIGEEAVSGVDAASADPYAIAIGSKSDATGEGSVAIGGDGTTGAQATADGATAIGGDVGGAGSAIASAAGASALGSNTSATGINAVAIGNGSLENITECVGMHGLTGAITPPSGTTAEAPGTPRNGMFRYDSTTDKLVVRIAGAWHSIDTTAV